MRVFRRKNRKEASSQGFVWVMDDFAALRSDSSLSSIGGYRLMRSGSTRRRRKPRPTAWSRIKAWRPSWPRLARLVSG